MLIKKCMCLYMSIVLFSVYGMQPEDNLDKVGWQLWVREAKTVQIRLILHLFNDKFPIDDATTIVDIKRYVHDREGVPTNQQKIHACYTDWQSLWRYSHSEELDDECYVKDVMHCDNTHCLIMHLFL